MGFRVVGGVRGETISIWNIDSYGHFGVTLLGASIGYSPILLEKIIQRRPYAEPTGFFVLGVIGAPLLAAIANNRVRISRKKQMTESRNVLGDRNLSWNIRPVLDKHRRGIGVYVTF